ncbi:FAD binding domain-containing protein [Apiospora phragmitis]|uniref:FAD binding domain-containing protein n=1 Tax=Apiospora phragmitis TaxID=2905665 RepID=A0ABR1TUF2_9PEZI
MLQPESSTDYDVLIVGGGSAGLCSGIWLARCGINFKILERRDGPMQHGQADGVQCRTVEVFESFGIEGPLLREAYHVLELAFWAHSDGIGLDEPDAAAAARVDGGDGGVVSKKAGEQKTEGIAKTHYAPDTEPGISHMPHVILNQARVNSIMTEEMTRTAGRDMIEYGVEVLDVSVDQEQAEDPGAYCVSVTAKMDGATKHLRAKYVIGCDGAHSIVRKSLGFQMIGDSHDAVWGVMDVYPRTNFPDIRKKALINSEAGNLIIIPREGDYLARFYIELPNYAGAAADITLADLHEKVWRIFRPYEMDIADTTWWSVYVIGQRRADHFTAAHRVFLTGDACHTHSPKAGQGMNVSLQDGYNLGWKLGAVLRGRAAPGLLATYVSERQKVAAELIEFDRYFTRLFSTAYRTEHGITPEHFREQIVRSGRYISGQALKYDESAIVCLGGARDSAKRLEVGMRFPSAQVVRVCDAKAMQLVRAIPSDSSWHIVVFAGDIRDVEASARLDQVSHELSSILREFVPKGTEADSILHVVLVLSGRRTEIEMQHIPEVFTPMTGRLKLKCLLNVFSDDQSYNSGHGHAYESYGIEPKVGALVVIRPDQYVSKVCGLGEVGQLGSFFAGFMKRAADQYI